jgi:alpha,alpha-trehalose phosphorylase
VAAEVGHLELAYEYLLESALTDLEDLQHNTRNGLHIASLAGTWIGLVAGFGGMRDHGPTLSFAPRLPSAMTGLTFRLSFRKRRLKVDVEHTQATYSLLRGRALEITHHGKSVTVAPKRPLTLPIPPPPQRELPTQPPHRAPSTAFLARRNPAPS